MELDVTAYGSFKHTEPTAELNQLVHINPKKILVIEDRAGVRGMEKMNKEFSEKFYYLTLVSAKGAKISITAVSKSYYEA